MPKAFSINPARIDPTSRSCHFQLQVAYGELLLRQQLDQDVFSEILLLALTMVRWLIFRGAYVLSSGEVISYDEPVNITIDTESLNQHVVSVRCDCLARLNPKNPSQVLTLTHLLYLPCPGQN